MTSSVSEFDRVAIGVSVARAFGLHDQWHEETIVDCQRIIAGILIRTQWPRDKWRIKVDQEPSLHDKSCTATLTLDVDDITIENTLIVIPTPNKNKRRVVICGGQYTNDTGNTDVDISDSATLVDIVNDAVNQLYDRFVDKARKNPTRP